MASLNVVVLGAPAVDLVARVDQLPRRDGIVLARSYERFPGGSPANVAVGLARLGYQVGFLGKLGDDEHGRLLLESFDQEGVDRQGVIVEAGRPTSTCFIALDDRGERMIVALPGVAVIERPDELDLNCLHGAQALYVGPSYAEVATLAAAVTHEDGGTVFYAPGGVRGPEDLEALRPVIDQAACHQPA